MPDRPSKPTPRPVPPRQPAAPKPVPTPVTRWTRLQRYVWDKGGSRGGRR